MKIDYEARQRIAKVEAHLARANKRLAVLAGVVLFFALVTGWVQW